LADEDGGCIANQQAASAPVQQFDFKKIMILKLSAPILDLLG
jgi:hypothetical protein